MKLFYTMCAFLVLSIAVVADDRILVVDPDNSGACSETVNFTGNFSVDSPTLFVDKSNNRVGIAKNNPSTALDVTGTVTATAFVGTLTGTASANPTISSGTLVAMPLTNTKKIGDIYIDTGSANAYICCATGADTTGWKQVNN